MKLDNKIDYSEFLKKLKISDYKQLPWKFLTIKHGVSVSDKKDSKSIKKEFRENVKKEIGKTFNGIYLYEKDGIILCIGKGKPIYKRVYSHYRESFEKFSGDTKYSSWHHFFSKKDNIGQLTVYWIEINTGDDSASELDRQILEKIYKRKYSPICDEFKSESTDFWVSKNRYPKSN
jgi:hypothetical protein